MPTNKHVRRLEMIQARKVQCDFLDDDLPAIYSIVSDCQLPLNNLIAFFLCRNPPAPETPIRYELPDGYIQFSSGSYGMASVQDFDIVQRAVVALIKGLAAYREDKAAMPGQTVEIAFTSLPDFCRTDEGCYPTAVVTDTLQRLATTYFEIERAFDAAGEPVQGTEYAGLIKAFNVISSAQTHQVERVEVTLGDRMYEEIVAE